LCIEYLKKLYYDSKMMKLAVQIFALFVGVESSAVQAGLRTGGPVVQPVPGRQRRPRAPQDKLRISMDDLKGLEAKTQERIKWQSSVDSVGSEQSTAASLRGEVPESPKSPTSVLDVEDTLIEMASKGILPKALVLEMLSERQKILGTLLSAVGDDSPDEDAMDDNNPDEDAMDDESPDTDSRAAAPTPQIVENPQSLEHVYSSTELSAPAGNWGRSRCSSPTCTSCPPSLRQGAQEIIKTAEAIYMSVLDMYNEDLLAPRAPHLLAPRPLTIVAPGQSPSYVALAIINLPIYDANKVDVVVLPLSHLSIDLENKFAKQHWMQPYADYLKEQDIKIRKRMILLDSVQSGRSMWVTTALLRTYHGDDSIAEQSSSEIDLKTIALHNVCHSKERKNGANEYIHESYDMECGSHMIYSLWPRLVQELDVQDLNPSNAEEMLDKVHFNKFTRFTDGHGRMQMDVYLKLEGEMLFFSRTGRRVTGTVCASILAPEKYEFVLVVVEYADAKGFIDTFEKHLLEVRSMCERCEECDECPVEFKVLLPIADFAPVDEDLRKIFNSQPDTARLPVLNHTNYRQNSVARMVIEMSRARHKISAQTPAQTFEELDAAGQFEKMCRQSQFPK
jgi:hypothetical protein